MKRVLACCLVLGEGLTAPVFAQDATGAATDAIKDQAVDSAKDKAIDAAKDQATDAVKEADSSGD